jgi:hypothetical protein
MEMNAPFFPRTSRWLAWRQSTAESLVAAPTYKKIRIYVKKLFELLRPFIEKSMRSRWPGRSISVDATFKLGSRVTGEKNSKLSFFIGEDGTVFHWTATQEENWNLMVPALYGIRDQLQELGKLHLLRYWVTDT